VIPRGQGCCGALAMHAGEQKSALSAARRNLLAFPNDVDASKVRFDFPVW